MVSFPKLVKLNSINIKNNTVFKKTLKNINIFSFHFYLLKYKSKQEALNPLYFVDFRWGKADTHKENYISTEYILYLFLYC